MHWPLPWPSATWPRRHLKQQQVAALVARCDGQRAVVAAAAHLGRIVARERALGGRVAVGREQCALDAEQVGLPSGGERQGDAPARVELAREHIAILLDGDGHAGRAALAVAHEVRERVLARRRRRRAAPVIAAVLG